MSRPEMNAIQRLLGAQASVSGLLTADPTAAAVALMHSKIVPEARAVVPFDGKFSNLPPEVPATQREALTSASIDTITWLTHGLERQRISGPVQTQQACELICALLDVIVAAVAVEPYLNTSSSKTMSQARQAAAFIQLDGAGSIIQALASTTKQLNTHVFRRPYTVPPLLSLHASLCWQRLGMMLASCWRALDPGQSAQAKYKEQCRTLMDWYFSSGLLTELAEGILLILALDLALVGDSSTGIVVTAMACARQLMDILSNSSTPIHVADLVDFGKVPLCRAAALGTGSDGTAPAPFLRLSLVLLAIDVYHKRTAALKPCSVPNQARGSKKTIKALRHALKHQLTPSCCSQLLQRLVPGLWTAITSQSLSPEGREFALGPDCDLCLGAEQACKACGDHFTELGERAWDVWTMCNGHSLKLRYEALGPQELQLLMECGELQAATLHHSHPRPISWQPLHTALKACPHPALVEFNTHHGRTLLTLAERSLEAALAAAGDADGSGGERDMHLDMTARLAASLGSCFSGGKRGQILHPQDSSFEAQGYPADAAWALLDPSTAPRLLRLLEALVRTPGTIMVAWELMRALPAHLPEMQLFYSNPYTACCTLSSVISMTKWLQGRNMVLSLVGLNPANKAAAAAAVAAAVPGAAGAAVAECNDNPRRLWGHTAKYTQLLGRFAAQSMARAARLLDTSTETGLADAAGPGSRKGRYCPASTAAPVGL